MRRDPDRATAPVVGIREDLPSIESGFHRHVRAQLVYAAEGALVVSTAAGTFVVPPQRSVWVPGGERHRVDARRPVRLRTLYFDAAQVDGLPSETSVVAVSPLLRELILEAVEFPWGWEAKGRPWRLVRVLVDELRLAAVAPLHLPNGKDPRVLRACRAMKADPSANHSLAELARLAHTSGRQLTRLFEADTGLTPARWREQLRLILALEQLAAGEPVLRVAIDLGYGSASSFGVMFKRALGASPRAYSPPPASPARSRHIAGE
jgi:AraC-like DNA-binding protein